MPDRWSEQQPSAAEAAARKLAAARTLGFASRDGRRRPSLHKQRPDALRLIPYRAYFFPHLRVRHSNSSAEFQDAIFESA